MDFVLISNRALSLTKNSEAEPFSDRDQSGGETEKTSSALYAFRTVWATIVAIVGILLSVFAVYLSWTCSTAQGQPIVMKIVLAIIAAIFSVLYIIIHYILVFITAESKSLPNWCSFPRQRQTRALSTRINRV